MKNQEIKVGDYVYIPIESTKPLIVVDSINWLTTNSENHYFNKHGLANLDDIQPIAFLATPENKTKIEQFYGIELEDVPNDGIDNFIKELSSLVELAYRYQNLENSSYPDHIKNFALEDLINQKQTLIEMFKDHVK